jgi:hypothetical protein
LRSWLCLSRFPFIRRHDRKAGGFPTSAALRHRFSPLTEPFGQTQNYDTALDMSMTERFGH